MKSQGKAFLLKEVSKQGEDEKTIPYNSMSFDTGSGQVNLWFNLAVSKERGWEIREKLGLEVGKIFKSASAAVKCDE